MDQPQTMRIRFVAEHVRANPKYINQLGSTEPSFVVMTVGDELELPTKQAEGLIRTGKAEAAGEASG